MMRDLLSLPNILTAFRVGLVPVLFLTLGHGGSTALGFALAVAVVAELTDIADGWVARTFNMQSDFGAAFDPLADSLYRSGAFLALAAAGLIPIWAVLVFVWRDVVVAYVRIGLTKSGRSVGARLSGKLKAFVQGVAIIALILATLLAGPGESTVLTRSAYALFWLAALVTVWSGMDYVLALRPTSDKAP
ncbi:CDP-diacylglycerol--glycerol-3-phosphate 3-phosphatidyltransferase [Maricaulis sp.]|uniref:CDP-diacylglycerol--glycerol-3-phosphate 3-phosphatidyltransferase n=1 Tax=Maricaulis sp. TaxID=1486257 RepID=UPI002B278466|nr:CDP-diacylglycerol--glycerol-3-phosphate 3-phosphatidyltransferase [Maricaulis sp.]